MVDSLEIMGGTCQDSLKVTSSSNEPIPEIYFCYLRLDFLTFSLLGMVDSLEIMGGLARTPLNICRYGSGCSGNAKLDFSFTGAASTRIFEIKATQAPDGCLQYHTNLDGRFETFNFAPTDENHLKDQNYAICIRQELGYCCVEYSVCPDVEDTGFTLGVDEDMAYHDNDCQSFDYVGIEDCSPPFLVQIFTNKLSDATDDPTSEDPNEKYSRGLCFEYVQIPCN
ncbi:hypothetical protein TCAL_15826 [Tigriopus californicus]|uniref:CUB domain-containing protein n=1 Tax=Tigriopus californicus TaxID=6832 RepID=A0A553NPI5_TIGCA|nr:hypothetical protein TCAL_15826 [Tigriopus californicus]